MSNVPRKNAGTTGKTAQPPAKRIEFRPLLLAVLKEAGIKVTVRESPRGNYCSFLVGGTNLAYVFKQSPKGMKVMAAATPAQAKHGFKASGRPGKFAAAIVVTKEAEIAKAVAGIKVAAEALTEAKTVKAKMTAKSKQATPIAAETPKGGS
jgi:hypothetical protein